jgi:opacity protein-like surface antigen
MVLLQAINVRFKTNSAERNTRITHLKGERMMQRLLVAAAIVLAFMSSNLYAQDKGWYMGIGGNYALQNFNTVNMNYGNSPGFNAKVGYCFSKMFAAEFVYDYFTNFSASNTGKINGVPATVDKKAKITTFVIAGKLSPDVGSEVFRPYITAGLGMMNGDIDTTVSFSGSGLKTEGSGSVRDECAKFGVGVDYFVRKNISVDFEASYVMGFGDNDDVRYTNLHLGVAYHF